MVEVGGVDLGGDLAGYGSVAVAYARSYPPFSETVQI